MLTQVTSLPRNDHGRLNHEGLHLREANQACVQLHVAVYGCTVNVPTASSRRKQPVPQHRGHMQYAALRPPDLRARRLGDQDASQD